MCSKSPFTCGQKAIKRGKIIRIRSEDGALEIGAIDYPSSFFLQKNSFETFITAARRSLRRQQYNNGFIDELKNATVSAICHASVQSLYEMLERPIDMRIGM